MCLNRMSVVLYIQYNTHTLLLCTSNHNIQGSVWTCDVNWDSSRLATGGADFTVRLWDVETGTQTSLIDDKAGLTATAKSVNFSFCGNLIGMFRNLVSHICK